jgi:hypothetical protein
MCAEVDGEGRAWGLSFRRAWRSGEGIGRGLRCLARLQPPRRPTGPGELNACHSLTYRRRASADVTAVCYLYPRPVPRTVTECGSIRFCTVYWGKAESWILLHLQAPSWTSGILLINHASFCSRALASSTMFCSCFTCPEYISRGMSDATLERGSEARTICPLHPTAPARGPLISRRNAMVRR